MLTTIVKSISTRIELIEIEKEAPYTYTYKFKVPASIKWTPGSYAHFLSSGLKKGEKVTKESVREFSIMSHPNEPFLGFTTRIRSNGSEFKQDLLNLEVGDEIRMFKIGNHLKKKETDKPVVFISMGVGVATFRPFILEYFRNSAQTLPLTNINIDRSGKFVYREELKKLEGDKLKNILVISRNDLYENIDQVIEVRENTYFIVGSKAFNKAIGDYLIEKNVSDKNIVFDKH